MQFVALKVLSVFGTRTETIKSVGTLNVKRAHVQRESKKKEGNDEWRLASKRWQNRH